MKGKTKKERNKESKVGKRKKTQRWKNNAQKSSNGNYEKTVMDRHLLISQ